MCKKCAAKAKAMASAQVQTTIKTLEQRLTTNQSKGVRIVASSKRK